MSIGSTTDGGASAIRVSDLSIDGAGNGLRIKSNITRCGLVRYVVYDDVCIRNTHHPILMDTNYWRDSATNTNLFPVFRDIVLCNVRVEALARSRWRDSTPGTDSASDLMPWRSIGPGAFSFEVSGRGIRTRRQVHPERMR
jgi:hypothetical protein